MGSVVMISLPHFMETGLGIKNFTEGDSQTAYFYFVQNKKSLLEIQFSLTFFQSLKKQNKTCYVIRAIKITNTMFNHVKA
jgi:hypothetical protein